MTIFEILKFNRELIVKLSKLGIKPDDCKYIDMYSDFESMKVDGYKVTYIVSSLSDKYAISERKVYDVIKRFGMQCASRVV